MVFTDAECFKRWHTSRDANAFTEIVVRHAGMVHSTCRRILGNAVDAEDAAQEAFLRLANQDGPVPCLGGWLHTTAVRVSLDMLRKETRQREREASYMDRDLSESGQDADLPVIIRIVDEAITGLPDSLRETVVLRFLEGRTQKDIGRQLGISRTAVQKRLDKGLDEIRAFLRRHGVTSTGSVLAAFLAAHFVSQPASAALLAAIGKQTIAASITLPVAIADFAAQASTTYSVIKMGALVSMFAMALVASFFAPRWFPSKNRPPEASNTAESRVIQNAEGHEWEPVVSSPAATSAQAPTAPPVSAAPLPTETKNDSRSLRISGTVSDDAVYTVPGADVWVEEKGQNSRAFGGSTNKEGVYRISGQVPSNPAPLYVFVRAQGYPVACEPLEESPAASSIECNFVLTRSNHFVKGIVVDENRTPIPDAEVSLIHFSEEDEQSGEPTWVGHVGSRLDFCTTDPRGRFEIWLRKKWTSTFSVSKKGYAEGRFAGIATDTENAVLVLEPGGAISGKVTRADGSPADGYTVAVVADCAASPPGQPSKPVDELRLTSVTDARGLYRLDGLSHQITYDAGVFSMRAGQIGRRELLQPLALKQNLTLGAEAELRDVDFQLTENPYAHLHGRLTDTVSGAPADGIAILLKGTSPFRLIQGAKTDADGVYDMKPTLSEKTHVLVSAVYVGDYGNHSAALTTVDGTPLEFSMEPGDDRSLDLLVPASASLPVRVTDRAGNPVAGQCVGIGSSSGPARDYGRSNWFSDADGHHLFVGLPPDKTYFVFARQATSGGARGDASMILAESESVGAEGGGTLSEVVLVVEVKGGIEGTLQDEAGNPIADAQVTLTGVLSGQADPQTVHAHTDAIGYFTVVNAFRPGRYEELRLTAPAPQHLNSVEIVDAGIVDLGTVHVSLQDQHN